jgi:hypothetical protein
LLRRDPRGRPAPPPSTPPQSVATLGAGGKQQKGKSISLVDLANIAQIVSGVGVVISLVYLAVQIRQNTLQMRQNTKAIRAAAFQEALNLAASMNAQIVADPFIARFFLLAEGELEALDPGDRMRWEAFQINGFRAQQNAFLLFQEKIISEEQWRTLSGGLRRALSSPATQAFWRAMRHEFVASFREYVDQLTHSGAQPQE